MSVGLFKLNLYAPRSINDADSPTTLSPEAGSTSVIAINHKSIDAYYRLLGGIDPIENLHRLIAFNRKVFTPHFRVRILNALKEPDPGYYYRDPKDIKEVFEPLIRGGNFGNLEQPWIAPTMNPNPHHLVPSSRWGTWNIVNIQGTCRNMHDGFHALFMNLTPVEQLRHIIHMLCEWFTQEFSKDFMQITAPDPDCPTYTPRAIDPIAGAQWISGQKKVSKALILGSNPIHWGYAATKRDNRTNSQSTRAR